MMSNSQRSGKQLGAPADRVCSACGALPELDQMLWLVPRTATAVAEQWLCRACLMDAFRSDAALDLAGRQKTDVAKRRRRIL